MRIVYVLTSLAVGGAERQTTALAARMAERGHAVALLVLRPACPGQCATGIATVHLGMNKHPASIVAGLARARRFLTEFRPDLLHSHCFHANIAARLLRIAVRRPVQLSTLHNIYEGGWQRMLAYRWTDMLSSRTTAVSAAVAQRFVRWGAVPAHKCVVVPNAIDLGCWACDAERRARLRKAMNAGAEFVWLAAGRLAPAKDYPTLLRAFRLVLAACPGARLWIAGAMAPQTAGPLRSLGMEPGLDAAVLWLGMRNDLSSLFDAADAFVMSSAWEGMPLALGEAMAMEKPVVATDVGGVRELLGDAGSIVPCRDPGALAAAMLAVMRWPAAMRQDQGRIARQRIAQSFSMEARAAQWEQLYGELLDGHSRGG